MSFRASCFLWSFYAFRDPYLDRRRVLTLMEVYVSPSGLRFETIVCLMAPCALKAGLNHSAKKSRGCRPNSQHAAGKRSGLTFRKRTRRETLGYSRILLWCKVTTQHTQSRRWWNNNLITRIVQVKQTTYCSLLLYSENRWNAARPIGLSNRTKCSITSHVSIKA